MAMFVRAANQFSPLFKEKTTCLCRKKCDYFIISWHKSIREASHIDFVHEKRHMDVLLETPPPKETSRTFFDFAEAPVAFKYVLLVI